MGYDNQQQTTQTSAVNNVPETMPKDADPSKWNSVNNPYPQPVKPENFPEKETSTGEPQATDAHVKELLEAAAHKEKIQAASGDKCAQMTIDNKKQMEQEKQQQ
mmetsp:Transcript_4888/g.10118  ORF Transcript_4888/g.10118 Transcript_4888/m.10118 type:complete len:104 (-) Transcript_4888:72-383(-)